MWKLAGLRVGILRLFDVLHTEKCVGVWVCGCVGGYFLLGLAQDNFGRLEYKLEITLQHVYAQISLHTHARKHTRYLYLVMENGGRDLFEFLNRHPTGTSPCTMTDPIQTADCPPNLLVKT